MPIYIYIDRINREGHAYLRSVINTKTVFLPHRSITVKNTLIHEVFLPDKYLHSFIFGERTLGFMTINIKKILYKNRFRIGLFFPESPAENALVKSIGALFSKTYHCWHLPYDKKSFALVKKIFKDHQLDIESSAAPPVILQHFEPIATVKEIVKKKITANKGKKLLPIGDISTVNIKEWLSMVQQLQLKGYSVSTQQTYKNEFGVFLKHLKKVPATSVTEERIKSYLQYCYATLKLSESTIHSRINALKFYYEQVLGRAKFFWGIPRPKKHLQLPKVISEEKILEGLLKVENVKHRVILMIAYSAGLRVSEVTRLKVTDINPDRMQIFIARAKGKKDRMATLSVYSLQLLQEYITLYRPANWLFEGQPRLEHISHRSAQSIFKQAYKNLGLPPTLSFHSLRHSYATHLLENGTDIRYIQELLGHNDINTTLRYTHVSMKEIQKIESPLDKLIRKQQLKLKESDTPPEK